MSGIGIHTDKSKKKNTSILSLFTEKGTAPQSTQGQSGDTDWLMSSVSPHLLTCCLPVVLTLSDASVEVSVEVVLLAEFVRERDAGEQLAPFALDRVDVEEHHEA